MPLPRGDEYLAAVQNPRIAFSDAELKICTPETDQFGIPKPYSGGFTTTFHLRNHSQHWAARCFTRAIPDLQTRYEAIGRFLQRHSDGFLVKALCLDQGIKVSNQWHPIIKMQWLQGETLNTFIDQNLSNPAAISNIIDEFVNLVRRLENLGVAHGDLQHGNILVKQGKVYLIDYDGFFLPELSSLKTNEIGHLNYQHPARSGAHFNATIDRFSSIVIYLGLLAVKCLPSLWKQYNNSENILFRADDFVNVETSQLLTEISSVQQLVPLVDRFRGVCKLDFDNLPTLDKFIAGSFVYPKVAAPPQAATRPVKRSQYPVIDAARTGSLREHIGARVEVIGKITDYHSARTRYGRPYLFLNFGSYPLQTFTLVLWSNALTAFSRRSVDPYSLVGKWVKVIGVIGSYRNNPQMTLDLPSQIQILSNKEEARQWLGVKPPLSAPSQARKQLSEPAESIFNTIYAGKGTTKVQTPLVSKQRLQAKKFGCWHGILGSVVCGFIASNFWGFWGLLIGAVIGYQIGKRL